MTPLPSHRASVILGAVLDLEADAREAFIVEASSGDAVLLAEVREILAAHGAMPTAFHAGSDPPDFAPEDFDATFRIDGGILEAGGGRAGPGA